MVATSPWSLRPFPVMGSRQGPGKGGAGCKQALQLSTRDGRVFGKCFCFKAQLESQRPYLQCPLKTCSWKRDVIKQMHHQRVN